MIRKLKNAVMGGTSVIISIENLDPIMVYDLKRNRSPNTKPTSPDRTSHIQFSKPASIGKNMPSADKCINAQENKTNNQPEYIYRN